MIINMKSQLVESILPIKIEISYANRITHASKQILNINNNNNISGEDPIPQVRSNIQRPYYYLIDMR